MLRGKCTDLMAQYPTARTPTAEAVWAMIAAELSGSWARIPSQIRLFRQEMTAAQDPKQPLAKHEEVQQMRKIKKHN